MIGEEELANINVLTERIIGCAIEVHRGLGPGLLEHTYEAAMCIELNERGMAFELPVSHRVQGNQNQRTSC